MERITKEQLATFCDPEDPFFDLYPEPFTLGDFSYVSDGKIIVRVEAIKEITRQPDVERRFIEGEERDWYVVAPIDSLPWDHDSLTDEWVAPPEIPEGYKKERECQWCNGTGKDCGEPCEDCNGKGTYPIYKPVEWRRGLVNPFYLEKLETLEAVQFNVHGKPEEIIRFRFKGGVGLLMPCVNNGFDRC